MEGCWFSFSFSARIGSSLLVGFLALNAPAPGFAQIEVKRDLNGDGIADSLIRKGEWASEGSSKAVTVIDGKTGEKFSAVLSGSFSEFIEVIPIDSRLLKEENRDFYTAVKKELLKSPERRVPDGSLKWLLESRLVEPLVPLVKPPLFSRRVFFNPIWKSGIIQAPDTYYLLIDAATGEPLDGSDPAGGNAPKRRIAWLVYRGRNHQRCSNGRLGCRPQLVDGSSDMKVYKTAHGIWMEKGGKYSWLFVTNAVGKLRRPSIQKVKIVRNLIFFLQVSRLSASLYVIDPERGRAARFNPAFFLGETDFSFTEFNMDRDYMTLHFGYPDGPSGERKIKSVLVSIEKLVTRIMKAL